MGSTHPSTDDEQNREEYLKSIGLVFPDIIAQVFSLV